MRSIVIWYQLILLVILIARWWQGGLINHLLQELFGIKELFRLKLSRRKINHHQGEWAQIGQWTTVEFQKVPQKLIIIRKQSLSQKQILAKTSKTQKATKSSNPTPNESQKSAKSNSSIWTEILFSAPRQSWKDLCLISGRKICGWSREWLKNLRSRTKAENRLARFKLTKTSTTSARPLMCVWPTKPKTAMGFSTILSICSKFQNWTKLSSRLLSNWKNPPQLKSYHQKIWMNTRKEEKSSRWLAMLARCLGKWSICAKSENSRLQFRKTFAQSNRWKWKSLH